VVPLISRAAAARLLPTEQHRDVSPRVQNPLNNHIAAKDSVEDDVLADWVTA
jgi:hypothetical protein